MPSGNILSTQRQSDFLSKGLGLPINKENTIKRPIAEKDKAPTSKGLKRKQDESLIQQHQESPPSKKAKTEGELFPNIEAKQALPEKGSEVDFNSSFLHKKAKPEVTKPELPKPETIYSHRQEPLINYNSRMSYKPTKYSSQFEKDLIGSDSGLMLKIANNIIEMRMGEQLDLLESFKHLNDKMRHIRSEKSKVLNDLAENAKLEDYWSSMRSLISYLTAGVGLVMGVGMAAYGVHTAYCGALAEGYEALVTFAAGLATIQSGVMTTIGGLGSIGSQWMQEKKYNEKMVNAIALCSSLLVGYNAIPQALPQSLLTTKTAMTAMKAFGGIGESISQHQISKTKANEYRIQAEANGLQFNREKNKSKQSKALGGMKLTELTDEVKAASGQIADEDRLKERIAQMLSSAA